MATAEDSVDPPTLRDRGAWLTVVAVLTAMGLDLAYLVWDRLDLLKYRPSGLGPQLLRLVPALVLFGTVGWMLFCARGRRLCALGMYLFYAAVTMGVVVWQWVAANTNSFGVQSWVRQTIYLTLVACHGAAGVLSFRLARREVSAGSATPPPGGGDHRESARAGAELRDPRYGSMLSMAPQSAAAIRHARGWLLVPMVYNFGVVMVVQAYAAVQTCMEQGEWGSHAAYLGWCLTNVLVAGVVVAWLYSDRVVLQALGAGAATCGAWLLFMQVVQEYHDAGGVVTGLILRLVPSSSADHTVQAATGVVLAIWAVAAIRQGTKYCLRLAALLHAGAFTSAEPADPAAIEVSGWDEGARK